MLKISYKENGKFKYVVGTFVIFDGDRMVVLAQGKEYRILTSDIGSIAPSPMTKEALQTDEDLTYENF